LVCGFSTPPDLLSWALPPSALSGGLILSQVTRSVSRSPRGACRWRRRRTPSAAADVHVGRVGRAVGLSPPGELNGDPVFSHARATSSS
jgi:hypothetical protein